MSAIVVANVPGQEIAGSMVPSVVPPTDVEQFCQRVGIGEVAGTAVDLVKRILKPERIRLEVGSDPDGDGEWLVIRGDVRGSVEEVLDRYYACKQEWIRLAPPSKVGLVCFLYNII